MARPADGIYNQEDYYGQGASQRQGQIRNQDEDRTTPLESVFVGSFRGRRRRGRILPSGTKTDHPSGNGNHPEHAQDGISMSRGRQDTTDDDHERSGNNGYLSTKVVASQANHNLSNNLSH